MAYGYYQPNYYQPYQPNAMQQQNNSQAYFVRVQNENDARMYPVAPGSSVIFLDENEPYCYTKTVDSSQLDRPKFEKYRLVKEDANIPLVEKKEYATMDYVKNIEQELLQVKQAVESFCITPDEST